MYIKSLFVSLFMLVGTSYAASDAPKIGHIGSSHHDAVIRHITENKAIVIAKPGAKGLIAFQALENKEVDFVVIASSPLYITPFKEPDLYKFDPLKKFKLIGVIAEMQAGFALSPKYASIADLRNKVGPILHASGGDESNSVVESTFAGKEIVHVGYRGQGQQIIDVQSGVADITFMPVALISSYGATPIETTRAIKLHLITRHDVSEERIQALKKLINSSIVLDRATEFSSKTKTKLIPQKGN